MNIFKKFFLVKEIVSKQGVIHFRRYRLLQTPWFAIYIHQICKSDLDKDMHDHPWHFISFILKGAYKEVSKAYPLFNETISNEFHVGDMIKHHAKDAHQITLLTDEVWTLVFTSGHSGEWGYQTPQGWINHKEYRAIKNKEKLADNI